MRTAAIVAAMTFASVTSGATEAAVFTYIVNGTVTGYDSVDSAPFGDVATGSIFTARFDIDDSLPTAIYDQGATGSSASGGGLIAAGTRPPVDATLTINGISRTIRRGDQEILPIDLGGERFGQTLIERDSGSVVKDAALRTLSLGAAYAYYESCCAPEGGFSFDDTEFLGFSLASGAFTSPDYRQAGTYAVSGTGNFTATYRYVSRSGGVDRSSAFSLAATSLSVSGSVPEPATWLMMILGFGLIGLRFRGVAVPYAVSSSVRNRTPAS